MHVDLETLGLAEGGYLLIKRALRQAGTGGEVTVTGTMPELDVDLFSLLTAFKGVLTRASRRPRMVLPPEQTNYPLIGHEKERNIMEQIFVCTSFLLIGVSMGILLVLFVTKR